MNAIDFGLVSLVVVLLILAGLCLAAYLSIRQEMRGVADVKTGVAQALAAAHEAKATVEKIEVEHYKGLVRRTDHLEEESQAFKRFQNATEEKIISLVTKYGALKRWSKAEEERSHPPDQAVAPELPQNLKPPPNLFGKKVA